MTRDEILRFLSSQRQEMAARFGVRRLALFGSHARDAAGPASDIDILVEFDGPASAKRYFGLQFFLEDHLGSPVDLVTEKALRDELRPHVESEAVRVA